MLCRAKVFFELREVSRKISWGRAGVSMRGPFAAAGFEAETYIVLGARIGGCEIE